MSSYPQFSDIDLSPDQRKLSFYDILGVAPDSTQAQIKDAYRLKSKQCHPDTTILVKEEAAKQFQLLNRAYDTLRYPEQRTHYDQWLQARQFGPQERSLQSQKNGSPRDANVRKKTSSSAFLDSEDRPLSPGEIFALFILVLTFLFCLLVAIFIGVSRGEMLVQSMPSDSSIIHQLESFKVIPTPKKRSSITPLQDSKVPLASPKVVKNDSPTMPKFQQQKAALTPFFSSPKSLKAQE